MKKLISLTIGSKKDHFLIDIVDFEYNREINENFQIDGILIMKESMKKAAIALINEKKYKFCIYYNYDYNTFEVLNDNFVKKDMEWQNNVVILYTRFVQIYPNENLFMNFK